MFGGINNIYMGGYKFSAHCTNISVHKIYFRASLFICGEYFLDRTAIEVDMVASADKNQQSPKSPWLMSLELGRSAKNLGFSNIWETRLTSGGISSSSSSNPYRHNSESFLRSNSLSLDWQRQRWLNECLRKKIKPHLNFLFAARHVFEMLSTFFLHSVKASSSSAVTRSPTCSFGTGGDESVAFGIPLLRRRGIWQCARLWIYRIKRQ